MADLTSIAAKDDEHRICLSVPYCLCVGRVNEWDECCCMRRDGAKCTQCGAPMVPIDVNSGEVLS